MKHDRSASAETSQTTDSNFMRPDKYEIVIICQIWAAEDCLWLAKCTNRTETQKSTFPTLRRHLHNLLKSNHQRRRPGSIFGDARGVCPRRSSAVFVNYPSSPSHMRDCSRPLWSRRGGGSVNLEVGDYSSRCSSFNCSQLWKMKKKKKKRGKHSESLEEITRLWNRLGSRKQVEMMKTAAHSTSPGGEDGGLLFIHTHWEDCRCVQLLLCTYLLHCLLNMYITFSLSRYHVARLLTVTWMQRAISNQWWESVSLSMDSESQPDYRHTTRLKTSGTRGTCQREDLEFSLLGLWRALWF